MPYCDGLSIRHSTFLSCNPGEFLDALSEKRRWPIEGQAPRQAYRLPWCLTTSPPYLPTCLTATWTVRILPLLCARWYPVAVLTG